MGRRENDAKQGEVKKGDKAGKEQEGWDRIWMLQTNSDDPGQMTRFSTFDDKGGSFVGFFGAMFDTARNWGDTELMTLPGYRDRIVHVGLAEDEGGMNLNMPREIIERVGERGALAGKLLSARFSANPGLDPQTGEPIVLDWDNHRWVRFRSFMASLEKGVRKMQKRWTAPGRKVWRSYEALLDRPDHEKPNSYPFRNADQKAFARQITKDIVGFVTGLTRRFQTFDSWGASSEGGAPRPKPVLRLMPAGHDDPRDERV